MTKIYLMNYYSIYIMLLLILFLFMNLKNHPIIMIIILLIYSSLICLNMCSWKTNYMYSIFLFLMMISGLLIIFLYFSSLISNEQFKFNVNLFMYFMMMNLLLMIIIHKKIKTPHTYMYKYSFQDTNPMLNINSIKFNNILNLYDYPLNNMTILLMFYLLFSLFSIMKICSTKQMSLRKIN